MVDHGIPWSSDRHFHLGGSAADARGGTLSNLYKVTEQVSVGNQFLAV